MEIEIVDSDAPPRTFDSLENKAFFVWGDVENITPGSVRRRLSSTEYECVRAEVSRTLGEQCKFARDSVILLDATLHVKVAE